MRIFDSFSFTNPVSYVWGSADFDNNTLTLRAPFDERTFTINDYSRSEDFIYGGNNEVWEGDSYKSTGIRVTWQSNDDTLQIDYSVIPTESFNGSTSTKTVAVNEFGNNFGISAYAIRKQIDLAAFVIDMPLTSDTTINKSIESIEIQHPNGDWFPFIVDNSCIDDLRNGRGSLSGFFYGLATIKNLPLDATLNFKMNNKNGLSYTFQREVGIVPFFDPFSGPNPLNCESWDIYFNSIKISQSELTENYVNATQLLRTVDYFPLPSVGDTMKYIHTRNEENAGTVEYNFYLLPLDITTQQDTTITLERHIFWIPSGFGGSRLDSAEVDTVSLKIKNRRFVSLDLFPEVDTTANGLHTYYPSGFENPHTEKIYIEPDTGQPPYNKTFITLSTELGIIKITRFIQYSHSGRHYLTYTRVF